MKNRIRTILLALAAAAILVASCATQTSQMPSGGLIASPKTFTISYLTIIVYGSPEQYHAAEMRECKPFGYTDCYSKCVHVLGDRRPGDYKIRVAWEVLGHEIMHVLEAYNLDVADPDTPGGYCKRWSPWRKK